jgi:drug/metabolite transporter (DMT)-like permease
MDLGLEIVMACVALAVALGAARRGNPGPSFFIAALAALNAISFLIRPGAHGDMLLAWAIALIAACVWLIARRISKRNRQAVTES